MKQDNLISAKSESWKMFDAISPRYDFLNHLLSFGLDIRWRKELAHFLIDQENQTVLDLATGTADVLLALFKNNPQIQKGYGIDLADRMLTLGRAKIAQAGLTDRIHLQHGDANHIPFDNDSFEAVTIAFGIRNVEDYNRVLREMHRVLKKRGQALILEFSLPNHAVLRALHFFYLRTLVPVIGGIFSGHYLAYRYLNQTIETFPYGDDFCELMTISGFKNVKANPLMGGIATIYQGGK